MLDEQDRRALAGIEQGLARQDPQFAQRMRARGEDRPFPTVLALCASLYILLPMVTLLVGWVAAAVTLALFALAIAIVLIRRRRRS
jgi:DUF3040 family protein